MTHFEELWTKAEMFSSSQEDDVPAIVHEIELKVSLYGKMISQDLPPGELLLLKKRVMGEILYSLTKLSAKENLDVFSALHGALVSKMTG